MRRLLSSIMTIWLWSILLSCGENAVQDKEPEIVLESLQIGSVDITAGQSDNVSVDQAIVAKFNGSLDRTSIVEAVSLTDDQGNEISFQISYLLNDEAFSLSTETPLTNSKSYRLTISDALKSADGKRSFDGAVFQFTTEDGVLSLESISSNDIDLSVATRITEVPLELEIIATFSHDLNDATINSDNVTIKRNGTSIPLSFEVKGQSLKIRTVEKLEYLRKYELVIESDVGGIDVGGFEGFGASFYSEVDDLFKLPEISDDELLTKVQEQTFKYFWDFGHPTSGLSRERNTSGETVTIGGSGFGVMTILVAIERGFITRQEGIDRLQKIVTFLDNADRFHGVWPHWMNGTTGETVPFSPNDDGGDLVETAFMIQGLLTVREYLNDADMQEASIQSTITRLWEEVEWDWYTQGRQDVLYWHWSPNFGWEKNHKISGWNESLIVYVLAAASPTHSIDPSVYDAGWARNGNMLNGKSFYNINQPLGFDKGGPLFFSHYSFVGLDPRKLEDQYANYWEQNVNHSLINRAHCVNNASNFAGYGSTCWGLTASDNHEGYSAHSPTNDLGVITPTAALSSFPYTPQESMEALKHFYYIMGDRLWGTYGFYDSFNVTEDWYADSHLAIDQGPIILMIENHRTGLLWDLFMSSTEVKSGLNRLNITY